jgi:hypothetical protein
MCFHLAVPVEQAFGREFLFSDGFNWDQLGSTKRKRRGSGDITMSAKFALPFEQPESRLLKSNRALGRLRNWVTAVANNQEYLDWLQVATQRLHRCGAIHRQTVPVHEVFRGQNGWRGAVEVFHLTGYPMAMRCCAWSHRHGPIHRGGRLVNVLGIQPVTDPQSAIKMGIMAGIKAKRKGSQDHLEQVVTSLR